MATPTEVREKWDAYCAAAKKYQASDTASDRAAALAAFDGYKNAWAKAYATPKVA